MKTASPGRRKNVNKYYYPPPPTWPLLGPSSPPDRTYMGGGLINRKAGHISPSKEIFFGQLRRLGQSGPMPTTPQAGGLIRQGDMEGEEGW